MLLKMPERPQGQQIHQYVIKLAESLQASGEINKLSAAFPSSKMLTIKKGLGAFAETECTTK